MGFSTNVAWWAFNLVNQYQDLNFKLINAEVRTKAVQVEAKGQQLVVEWEREADAIAESSHTAALEMLTRRSNAFAEDVVADWWQFAWSLFAKYRGFKVTSGEGDHGVDAKAQAYPAWWLESADVGFTLWSPQGPFHGVPDEVSRFGESALADKAFGPAVPAGIVALGSLLGMFAMVAAFQAGRRHGKQATADHYVAYPRGHIVQLLIGDRKRPGGVSNFL